MILWWVVLFPLIGAFINGFVLPARNKLLTHLTGSLSVGASFVCSLLCFLSIYDSETPTRIQYGFSWINAGPLEVPFELVLDHLSSIMLLIITGIGTLIHIYAGGYMHEEKSTARFFAYLNLFVFMMLLLVLGNNMLVMFVGWEGVGLCSYLLIGYWYSHEPNAMAGMKAFVVNRIGDLGFLIGIFLTYKTFGTLSFSELAKIVSEQPAESEALLMITYITLAMFVGAMGKSAQLPLYVWLPDAMAGPTPVSALIHAATMVTAGIYMMTRLHFFYYLAPSTMLFIAFVGATTALFAASIALVQTDIKKVLAYSTVSQLGFMVLACGVGAFDAGVFHLLTHACFKALLFLGAGSVIVAMHHKQDMREMGGLARHLPITHGVFLVGVLAIIGFPGLSGFFSKDEILWKAFIFPKWGFMLWIMGVIAASFTAFYMVRLLCLTFYGPNRSDEHTRHHLHETPAVMWAPLVVLAFLSAFVGYLGLPEIIAELFHGKNLFAHFLASSVSIPSLASHDWAHLHHPFSHDLEWGIMFTSTGFGLLSAGVAFQLYRFGPSVVTEKLSESFPHVYSMLLNKYWVDEFYDRLIIQPLKEMSSFLWKIIDVKIINGFINGLGHLLLLISGLTSLKMSGNLQRQAMLFVFGVISLIFVSVLAWSKI